MRLAYIVADGKIIVEVQTNRGKLAPFIRQKKVIESLSQQLSSSVDKDIFRFITMLNQLMPPFEIHREFISIELAEAIKSTNFVFYKNGRNSLKKLNDFTVFNTLIGAKKAKVIAPNYLKVYISHFSQLKANADFYFEFNDIEKDIPIEYSLQIPLFKTKELAEIDKIETNKLFDIFNTATGQEIFDARFLTYENINNLSINQNIKVLYRAQANKHKSVTFVSNTLFKMSIFNKDDIDSKEMDLYYSILANYLQNKRYVEYDDKVILFDEEEIIEEIDNKTLLKVFSYNLNQNIRIFIDKILSISALADKLSAMNELEYLGFKATLKNYQEDGAFWLYNLFKNRIDGGLLADEMGLGKTIQVIAFLLLSKTTRNLIVAPASLVHNWKNEILKFTVLAEDNISFSIDGGKFLTILSYEYMRSNIEELRHLDFEILVMDESQKIKNHNTQIFNAVAQIKRDFTVIMTGTPIENSLNDLWNMLFAINPSLHELYTARIQPLLSDKEEYGRAIELTINMLHPIMLQRKKAQVLNLMERSTKTIFIDFESEEKSRYTQLLNIFISALKSGLSGRVQSIALEGLLRLRQYCSIHQTVPRTLITAENIKDSKVEKTIEIIKDSMESNEKIIVFSQFTRSLDILEMRLQKHNLQYLRLDGSTTKNNRDKYAGQFQDTKSKYNIFLISLKAGGVGLNLTSARSAILFEPWWNPAVEEQAFARIDRIGQEQATKVYRLIYKDSIEEKINTLVEHKQVIFDSMSTLLINRKDLEMEVARDIFQISKN